MPSIRNKNRTVTAKIEKKAVAPTIKDYHVKNVKLGDRFHEIVRAKSDLTGIKIQKILELLVEKHINSI